MDKMPVINFDGYFADFTSQWVSAHQGEYRNYDEMEDDMPNVYLSFLNTPASWLDGITPGAYFTQFDDPKVLVDWLNKYCNCRVPVPDLLTEQIVFVGKPCEKRLLELLKDTETSEEAKMTAIGLLREMKSSLPKMLYINWQLDRAEKDEMRDNALESLEEMGETVVQPILQVIDNANIYGKEALLDVLSRFPGNSKTLKTALELFDKMPQRRAVIAGYLARIGDEKALPALIKAAGSEETGYLTYIELRNAIEELGGDCPERTFDEDPEYEALRNLDQIL